jgi:hypothetical protein
MGNDSHNGKMRIMAKNKGKNKKQQTSSQEPYKIFLDDLRETTDVFTGNEAEGWKVCRTSTEAIKLVTNKGYMPIHIAFDHDLGETEDGTMDTSIKFITWMVNASLDERIKGDIPGYSVHSTNPVGVQNIISKMETWKKIATL